VNRHSNDPLDPFLTFKLLEEPRFLIETEIAGPSTVSPKLPYPTARITFNPLSIKAIEKIFVRT
jgi:hypothetical protein